MFASTFLLTAAGTIVTEKIVEPRLGAYEGGPSSIEPLSGAEKKGLRWAGLSTILFCALLAIMVIPEGSILRDPETGGILHSPFLRGIVAVIFVFFLVPGLAYGIATKSVKNDADAVNAMSKQMSALGAYIVLVFFAAQFVAFFGWTNLGIIFAIKGAEFLKSIGLTGIPLMLSFIVVATILNLFMGSASAKWAIMAPVFIPMFMLLGYSPELTQVLYRIGDSTTNIITPMMSYFALIVAFSQAYKKDAGIGTIMAMMLPYTFVFLIVWSLFLLGWVALDIPVGPGAPLYLPSPVQ
jgi:aminobenzoyl-glutamate transport protein